jgi:hypothetical protein
MHWYLRFSVILAVAILSIAVSAGLAAGDEGIGNPGVSAPVQVSPNAQGNGATITFTQPGAGGGGGGTAPGAVGPGGPVVVNPWTPTNIAACQAQGGSPVLIPCPQAGPPGPPAPPPQPGGQIVAGATLTLQQELPQPKLTVQPGYAVTGLRAYLQIDTPDNLPFTFQGFRNAVSMVCHWTSFDVAWGDGAVDTGITSTGGPWPDGDVTHVYQQASPGDDLRVTEHWSCPWHDQIGGAGILQLQTQGDLPLEIREIQTVSG